MLPNITIFAGFPCVFPGYLVNPFSLTLCAAVAVLLFLAAFFINHAGTRREKPRRSLYVGAGLLTVLIIAGFIAIGFYSCQGRVVLWHI